MVSPTLKSHLSEVYESSAHVHQALARFSQNYGAEAVQPLIPDITHLFEQLEEIISAKDATHAEETEKSLKHVLHQIDETRRLRVQLGLKFDTDFSNIIEQWRAETSVLEERVASLKEEVQMLKTNIKNREFDVESLQAATNRQDTMATGVQFDQVQKLVTDIKSDILQKERYLEEAHHELDANIADLQRATDAVAITKEINKGMRWTNSKLRDEKDAQFAALRKLEVQVLYAEKEVDRTSRKEISLSSMQAVLGDAGSGSLDGRFC